MAGTLRTNSDGERYIEASSAVNFETGSVKPLFMIERSLGGDDFFYNASTGAGQKGVRDYPEEGWQPMYSAGLNNIGLLVTTWGNVTYAGTGEFWIDDGSALDDGSGHIGVKVIGPPPTPDPVGKYVKVTGISSCEKKGSDLVRLIRALEVAEVH